MRVNVYAEEMSDRLEIIAKEIDGQRFTGLRFYLELPVTIGGARSHRSVEGPDVFPPVNGEPAQVAGPFEHRPGDDDSAAVTFWGKRDLRDVLRRALALLDAHYQHSAPEKSAGEEALDKIAQLCGCAAWEYPAQVVRDVGALVVRMTRAADALERVHRFGVLGGFEVMPNDRAVIRESLVEALDALGRVGIATKLAEEGAKGADRGR